MKKKFRHIAIVGVGLIGGSLALSIKKKNLAETVTGYGRNIERMKKASLMGIVDEFYTGFEKGLDEVDLVIIGTPVQTIASTAKKLMPYLKPGTVVTDVGSVKQKVVEQVESIIPDDIFYIGGHPIAGTENSGFEASFAELFEDRICVLTANEGSNKEAVSRLAWFWEQVGAHVIHLEAEKHDRIFAAVSHLPHMVAFSMVNALVEMKGFDENILKYSAGGFKDFTRIAASDPVMWRDIALMNRDQVLSSISCFETTLSQLKNAIIAEDGDEIEELFRRSRDARRQI